jgi:hypothetical protein
MCTSPITAWSAKQTFTRDTAWGSSLTGTVAPSPDHARPRWPAAMRRAPEYTCTDTSGLLSANRPRRIAEVSRGSVSPLWQALASNSVDTSLVSGGTDCLAVLVGACASVTANATAISVNPAPSAILIRITCAAAQGC